MIMSECRPVVEAPSACDWGGGAAGRISGGRCLLGDLGVGVAAPFWYDV